MNPRKFISEKGLIGREGVRRNFRIFEARSWQNLKQWQLANLIGIHNTEMSKIETGRTDPSDELKQKIAEALRVNVEDLF